MAEVFLWLLTQVRNSERLLRVWGSPAALTEQEEPRAPGVRLPHCVTLDQPLPFPHLPAKVELRILPALLTAPRPRAPSLGGLRFRRFEVKCGTPLEVCSSSWVPGSSLWLCPFSGGPSGLLSLSD